jgi:hypothetical protein
MKALDLSELERKTTSRVHRARGREGTRATDPPLVGLPPVSVSYEMAEMKRPIATIATAIPRLRSTLLPIITLPVWRGTKLDGVMRAGEIQIEPKETGRGSGEEIAAGLGNESARKAVALGALSTLNERNATQQEVAAAG